MVKLTRQNAKKLLADVPAEFMFYCHDGKVFKNMEELKDGLVNMSDDIYSFHANENRNDFSKWVRDVIKDDELADGLSSITVVSSSSDAARLVGTRITVLSRIRR